MHFLAKKFLKSSDKSNVLTSSLKILAWMQYFQNNSQIIKRLKSLWCYDKKQLISKKN